MLKPVSFFPRTLFWALVGLREEAVSCSLLVLSAERCYRGM